VGLTGSHRLLRLRVPRRRLSGGRTRPGHDGPFLPWLAARYPADRARLFTPEGRFIQNGPHGARVVPLLREWQQGEREAHKARNQGVDDG
jgi:hypothetical protein